MKSTVAPLSPTACMTTSINKNFSSAVTPLVGSSSSNSFRSIRYRQGDVNQLAPPPRQRRDREVTIFLKTKACEKGPAPPGRSHFLVIPTESGESLDDLRFL